ncbi:MAG: haloacid dehalogenase-like hydrolase [Oscillospiraceae bacterium]|nr:haloacid dehalogenase-like hydrolase [Oscillospiraceae bacterium]
MNVYDFDKTVFRGDSTVRLLFYALAHVPASLLTLPSIVWGGAMYLLRLWPKRRFKEKVYAFCRYVPDMDSFLEGFWNRNFKRIYKWFLDRKTSDDLIISASSEFALRPVCAKLGVNLIATAVDPSSGKYLSENCHGPEKLRRFRELYPSAVISEFYSDSRSDAPLAKQAEKAYLVRGGKIIAWY